MCEAAKIDLRIVYRDRARQLLAVALGVQRRARRHGCQEANDASVSVEALARGFMAIGLIGEEEFLAVMAEAEVYRGGPPEPGCHERVRQVLAERLDYLDRARKHGGLVANDARVSVEALASGFLAVRLITEEDFGEVIAKADVYRGGAPSSLAQTQSAAGAAYRHALSKMAERVCGSGLDGKALQAAPINGVMRLSDGMCEVAEPELKSLSPGGPTATQDVMFCEEQLRSRPDPSPIEVDVPLTVPVESSWQAQADRLGL